MKALTEKVWRTSPNGWGQDSTAAEQVFEVEPIDVGVTRENWRGYRHSSYQFTHDARVAVRLGFVDLQSWAAGL